MENKPHALPDVLKTGLKIVFCGTAAGEESARRQSYYAGQGNRFWATLHEVGLTPRKLEPEAFAELLNYGIGLTDIAKCRAGNDDVLKKLDFDVQACRAKLVHYAPLAISFNGKRAASVLLGIKSTALSFGRHPNNFAGAAVWILPSTSAAARAHWDLQPWLELAAFVKNST
jgi:TDG/mug DNA glycosylase family protein